MNAIRICSVCNKPLATNAPQGLCPECLLKAALGTGVDVGPDSQSQAESGKVSFVAPTPDELAKPFPQLEIMGFVGQGGMGAVYKARQKALERVVALKILPPGIGRDPAFAERFAREAKALAKLNHPGIVTLYEFGQADGLFFFLMEFVDGVNLRQLLDAGRLSPREALAIVPQICDALQYAHDQGIIHRDIKPENILLDRQGRVKVADFGLAKLVGTEGESSADGGVAAGLVVLTEAGKLMGTPQYMAPEQREHPTEVDHRADIYSLGVVFYQMLTGELPGKPIEAPSRKVQIDVRLDEVVLRALEENRGLRYQQVSEVKTMVESISSSSSPGTGTAPSPARPAATRGRLRAALMVGVLAWLFVTGIVTLITWIRPESWNVVAVISCPHSQRGRPMGEHFKFTAAMIELIRSDVILGRVIDRLQLDERSGKLDERWGRRNLGLNLTKAQAMVLLKRRLDVRSEGGTLFQVGVFGKRPEEPEEAMDIANTIAEELRAFRIEQHESPADMLEMTLRFTPPKVLLGLAAGLVLGLLAGGLVLWRGFSRRGPQANQVRTAVETIAPMGQAEAGVSAVPSPANRTDNSAPRRLNVGTSLVTTPEQLGTFDGQFFLYRRRSQLLLDDRQLTVSRAGAFTVIPLTAIRDLSIGHYPRTMHPMGLDFISVTYDADGRTQRLYFSPYESWFGLPSNFNRIVAEWFAAIRAAVVTATGREPGNTPAEQLGVPSGSKVIYALLLAPVALCGIFLLAGVLAGVVMRQHAGGAATHSLRAVPYVIILEVLGLGFLTLALALGRLFGGSRKPAAPSHLSRTAVVALLLSLGGCVLSLLLGLVLFQSWGWVFGSFFAIETTALILGIVAWDKRTGKAAVILSFALMLAWIPGTLTHMAQVAPNRLPRESPRNAAATSALGSAVKNAISRVRCDGGKATIEYEIDDAHELFLFVGPGSRGWSAWYTGTTSATATVEASDQIKLEDGSLGRGFIFQAKGSRAYVALTPDGPVPFGELVFREDANVTEKDGTFTFADIRQADGTLIPVSIRVRPVSGKSSGSQSFGTAADAPTLRFLAWQDENPSWRDWKAWRPNGEHADTVEEQRLLNRLLPTRIDLSATKEGRGVRVLFVWFSHPSIERHSYAEMTMADSTGRTIPPCLDGYGGGVYPTKPSEGELGWLVRWFAPARDATLPSTVNLTLRYSLGDWQFPVIVTREMFGGTMDTEWGNIPGAGETLDGKAFVSLARDTTKGRNLQVDFAAETTDGRLIEPSGTLASGPPEMRHGRFLFDAPLRQIKEFRLRTCPIRTVEYRNVSLQAGLSTDVQVSPVSSSQPAAFGPVIERVIATQDADDLGLVFFDMETGKSFKPPFPLELHPNQGPAFVELTRELKQWIRARDVDVLLHLGEENWDMMTLEMQEGFAGQLNEWETISPEKVIALFVQKDAEHLVRDEVPASSFGNSYRDRFGSFNAFRTRSNTVGVYQFEGVDNSTRRGVGFRYKLVHGADSTSATPSQTSASKTFSLRYMLASEMADDLRQILLGRFGLEARPAPDNMQLTVTAPPDVLNRVSTFITVADWPNRIARGSDFYYPRENVELAARSFFYACSIEDADGVALMLSPGLLAGLSGTSLTAHGVLGEEKDAELVRQLRGNWPGKEAAVREVIQAWNRFPLQRLWAEPGVAIGFGLRYFATGAFEGAPEERTRLSFIPDRTGGTNGPLTIDTLPPWLPASPGRKSTGTKQTLDTAGE